MSYVFYYSADEALMLSQRLHSTCGLCHLIQAKLDVVLADLNNGQISRILSLVVKLVGTSHSFRRVQITPGVDNRIMQNDASAITSVMNGRPPLGRDERDFELPK